MYEMSRRTKTAIAVFVIAALAGAVWFGVGYYLDSWNVMTRAIWHKFVIRQFFPDGINLSNATPLFFAILTIAAGVTAFFWLTRLEGATYYQRRTLRKEARPRIFGGIMAVLCVISLATTFVATWDNDKDEANSYLGTTRFVVEDINALPSSLAPLVDGATKNEAGSSCAFTSKHDTTSCVTEGIMPNEWDKRVASATGAEIVMARTSDSVPNTTLMGETLTYMHNYHDTGGWTAIRNGKNRQPIHSIVSWNGDDSPESCRFTGNYALNYAFGGKWGQNLDDTLADQFPGLMYEHDDMWGACGGFEDEMSDKQPVIVIPVTQQESYGHRTTLRAAGILIIQGTPSGEPKITHHTSVTAEDGWPGPVYPTSLVAKQREMVMWAAGRGSMNRLNFGYETTDVASQSGNSSEYLLRSKKDGRLYWVTPMKPRSTDSQQLVAYSITPADEVTAGKLNVQNIYVLPDNDPRIVNVDDMEARVGQAVRDSNPGFFTGDNPGRIAEFLPVDGDTWQAFAEFGGRVVYRIEVPSSAKITPTVHSLEGASPDEKSETTCSKTTSEMSADEILACLDALTDELRERQTK